MKKDKVNQDSEQMALLGSFAEEKEKHEIIEVLKQLFDKEKINMISELSDDEIKLITAIQMCKELKNIEVWGTGADVFMGLLVSRNRKSRLEVIEAVKGYSEKLKGLQKLIPTLRGNRL